MLFISMSFVKKLTAPLYFEVPIGWPKPHYNFNDNPLTEEGFQLGRNLFYDPILSKDNTISCASCHLQATGFIHFNGTCNRSNGLHIQMIDTTIPHKTF